MAATATTTGDNGDEEDWLAGPTVSRAATVSIRERGLVGCAARLAEQQRQDQVQVKMRPPASGGQQQRQQHHRERQAQESSGLRLPSDRWAPRAVAPSERGRDRQEVGSANVKSRHNLRRRRRGRCRPSRNEASELEAREAKEGEENTCPYYETRRSRVHLGQLRGARGSKSNSVSMWPSWRQLVLISFLSLAFASLLSTMLPHAASSAGSSCLLFKHSHALPVSPSGNSVGSNKSSDGAADEASGTAGVQLSSTETPRALRLNQQDEQSTAPAASSLRAQTTVAPPSSSLDETGSQPGEVIATDDRQPDSSTQPPSSQADTLVGQSVAQQQQKSSRPLSPIKHWFQQQQARLMQLGNSNETGADSFASELEQTGRNKDNNDREQQQQHLLSADNYRAGAGQDDNNGSLQSLQPLASSITRADLKASLPLVESPAATAVSHLGSSGSSRRQQYSSSGDQSGANVATVPNSSAASAIKLIASPSLAPPSEQSGHQPSRAARRRLNSTSQLAAIRPSTFRMATSSRTEESSTEAPPATGTNVTAPATATIAPMTTTMLPQATATLGLELSDPGEKPLSRASGRSSTPAAHLQPAATRRQFLVPAGLPHGLLQSAVREALNDLMVSTGEQIFSAASAARPLVLRPHSIVSALANGEFNLQQHQHQNQQQSLPAGFSSSQFGADLRDQRQSQRAATTSALQEQPQGIGKAIMSIASSASAPSISLPPLSHLLAPRNPLRLFASSSAPAVARYRAAFLHSSGSGKPASSANRWLMGSSRNKQQQQQLLKQSQTNFATFANMEPATDADQQQQFPMPMLPASFYQRGQQLNLDEQASSSTPNLYAHSHSARQLEQLVRAASQSSGLQSPILPAIVSAPAGAIPGFYIPAIESESDSQVSESRHGEPTGSAANSLISSKIPGTDYILHPDEVRAMIGIGELAWRAQQQQEQLQGQRSASADQKGEGRQVSNTALRQVAASNLQPQQQDAESEKKANWNAPINHYQIGWVPENHAENMRDYSYVDAQMRGESMQTAHSSNNQQQHPNQQQPYNQQQTMLNNSNGELVQQLAKHFGQNRLKEFPAIIRVNDQDYVHWPLIRISTADATGFDSNGHFLPAIGNQNQQANSFQQSDRLNPPGQEHRQRHQQSLANQESRLLSAAAPALNGRVPISPPRQQPGNQQLEMANSALVNQQEQSGADLEHSPMRLATQLTPNEIRQVEESIIEALIMSQTIQHQRKLMEHLTANKDAPVFVKQPGLAEFRWPAGDANQQNKERARRFRNGFFGRRRRRNSANQANQQQPEPNGAGRPTMAAAESSLQFFPLLNMSAAPVRVLGPLMRYDSLEDSMTSLGAGGQEPRRPHRHLPVVMADQETNKPSLLADSPASPLALLDTPLLSESTETRASILSPSAATLIAAGRQAMRPIERTTTATAKQPLAFGSRVSAPRGIQEQQPPSSGQGLEKAASTTRGQQAPLIRGPLYDDDDADEQSSQRRQPAGQQHRQRVNVDWPGMVSDADYFPRPNEVGRSVGSQAKRTGSRQSSTGLQQQVSSAESRYVGNNLVAASGAGTWPGNSFVTSQLKLQFAHDYQAREGVPIYNNNVRVAGGLERQRSLASQPRHRVSAPLETENALANEEEPEEMGEFDDDKTGARFESRSAELPTGRGPTQAQGMRRPSSRATPQFGPNETGGNQKLNHQDADHQH